MSCTRKDPAARSFWSAQLIPLSIYFGHVLSFIWWGKLVIRQIQETFTNCSMPAGRSFHIFLSQYYRIKQRKRIIWQNQLFCWREEKSRTRIAHSLMKFCFWYIFKMRWQRSMRKIFLQGPWNCYLSWHLKLSVDKINHLESKDLPQITVLNKLDTVLRRTYQHYSNLLASFRFVSSSVWSHL